MREIKFRAWDKSAKKYRYPKLWDNTMPSNWEQHYDLEQFTGLKDKTGVEIYEGDIVKHFDHSELIREVIFMKGSFGYWTGEEFISYASNYHFEWLDLHKSEKIEVIGNIHYNPELLDPR